MLSRLQKKINMLLVSQVVQQSVFQLQRPASDWHKLCRLLIQWYPMGNSSVMNSQPHKFSPPPSIPSIALIIETSQLQHHRPIFQNPRKNAVMLFWWRFNKNRIGEHSGDTATPVISRHKRFFFKPVYVMTMKHLNLRAKNYKLLVLEEHFVPGLCTDMT